MVMMMVVAVTMAMVVMMTAENRTMRHNNDLAHLMDVPVVVNMLADHLLVKVERLRGGRKTDGERKRGDPRKQRLGEHLYPPVGCSGWQMSKPHANDPSNAWRWAM